MNEIWANRLVAGTKVWADVPLSRRNDVKGVLAERVESEAITAARFEAITGEEYTA